MRFLEIFRSIVGEVVRYKKENKKPEAWEYEDLLNQQVLYSSDYLNYLADHIKYDFQADLIHQYMNNFRGSEEAGTMDIYSVDSYYNLSTKLAERKWS